MSGKKKQVVHYLQILNRLLHQHKQIVVAGLVLLIVLFIGFFYSTNNVIKNGGRFYERGNVASIFYDADKAFRFNDKTFVPYDDAIVTATIYTDASCETCTTPQQLSKRLRELLPTLTDITISDSNTPDSVAYVPTAVFSANIDQTRFFREAQDFFFPVGDSYGFFTHGLGMPVGGYVSTPQQSTIGNDHQDAENTLTLFVSPDCPECKIMNDVLTVLENKYGTKISTSYYVTSNDEEDLTIVTKNIHCAAAEEKGPLYLNNILANQAVWSKAKDLGATLTTYGVNVGITQDVFTACVASEKNTITAQEHERVFDQYGVTRVPTLFVDTEKIEGVQTIAEIEKRLAQ